MDKRKDKKLEKTGILETLIGLAMDVAPIICAVLIVGWAGRAYAEGHGLFVQKPLDSPGEAHSEMVTITEEDAGSALAVGRILEEQNLISSRFAFAVKAKLIGADDTILPGTFILSSDMTMEQMLARLSVEPGTYKNGSGGNGDGQAGEGDAWNEAPAQKENKDVWGQ